MTSFDAAAGGAERTKRPYWVGTDDGDREWGVTDAYDAEDAVARMLGIPVAAVRDLIELQDPIEMGQLVILRCVLPVLRAVDGSSVQVGVVVVDEFNVHTAASRVTTYVAVPHTRAGHSVFHAAIARAVARRSLSPVPPAAVDALTIRSNPSTERQPPPAE